MNKLKKDIQKQNYLIAVASDSKRKLLLEVGILDAQINSCLKIRKSLMEELSAYEEGGELL